MKKILVPTDFSATAENALRYALLFGQDNKADIEVFNVIPPEYQALESAIVLPDTSRARLKSTKEMNKSFVQKVMMQTQASHQLNELPNLVERVEIGLPVTEIMNLSVKEGFDLIVLGTQGEHSRMDRFLGTVSGGVIANAKIPVLVVPEHFNFKAVKRIAIAIDLKESDPWEIFKATDLIGSSLEEVNLVHFYPSGKKQKTEIEMDELKHYFDNNKQSFAINYSTEASDNLHSSLGKFVSGSDTDLVVMLGPHLSGFKKLFFQSLSSKMIHLTKIPLLRIN